MTGWLETFLNILVAATILIVSYLLTNWYARKMYNRCPDCGTLNAKRRHQCRACATGLRPE